MLIKEDALSIIDMYDTFFVDVYGVLFDGIKLFENTLSTMKTIKNLGKRIVILSNTTQIALDAKTGYAQRGIFEGEHYDEAITSGEFLRQTIINKSQEFAKMVGSDIHTVKCIFMGNSNIFSGSHITTADSYEDADFVYVGVPRASYGSLRIDNLLDTNNNLLNIEDVVYSNWNDLHDDLDRRGPSEFAASLENCLKNNKVLVVANPDIFAHGSVDNSEKKVPIFTQGSIGRYYERLGGKVIYFGKPHHEIFEFAKQYAKTNDKIAMIGDTPWTDILGANVSEVDSVMTMTGVSEEFLDKMNSSLTTNEKLDILFNNISPKMTDISGSVKPKHIIKRFAHNFSDNSL